MIKSVKFLCKFNFSCMVVDGNHLAKGVVTSIYSQIRYFQRIHPFLKPPALAIILVGDNSASLSYVNKKIELCAQFGVQYELYKFKESTEEAKIIDKIHQLNQRKSIDAILIQLPLPYHYSKHLLINTIANSKDVDQLQLSNYQHLIQNEYSKLILPCTPAGILYILDSFNINLEGLKATVVGRSNLVGFPLAMALINRKSHVTICHEFTPDLEENIRKADLVVSAVGKRHLIKGDWIKEGAAVIDVGINDGLPEDKKKLVGDVEFKKVNKLNQKSYPYQALKKASLITPVPGGVGPLTVAMLLNNVFQLWCAHKKLRLSDVEEQEDFHTFAA